MNDSAVTRSVIAVFTEFYPTASGRHFLTINLNEVYGPKYLRFQAGNILQLSKKLNARVSFKGVI